ncbi:hypothetical protein Ahy_A07g037423 isoform E [Arachis hypogaea]|uniref:Uncharacterized protein n=1 Tax=Arachis hypogaea TaxID=3818 RepID=A0A445CIP8_ARAHY|nr:hypothetical protein Ahy_A07g037423 isoform E [Arachis hypogaea]
MESNRFMAISFPSLSIPLNTVPDPPFPITLHLSKPLLACFRRTSAASTEHLRRTGWFLLLCAPQTATNGKGSKAQSTGSQHKLKWSVQGTRPCSLPC